MSGFFECALLFSKKLDLGRLNCVKQNTKSIYDIALLNTVIEDKPEISDTPIF